MRLLKALAWGAVFWLLAMASALFISGESRECYLAAVWDGRLWHYGHQVCLPEEGPGAVDEAADNFDPELAWMAMDVDLLADVAMGEDHDALAAVMWTVLNRACRDTDGRLRSERAAYVKRRLSRPPCPYMLESVIQRGHHYGTTRGGRFLPSWSRVPGRRWARFYPGQWVNAQEVAWRVLLGLQGDPTGGADHFHRAGTWRPPWAPQDVSDWTLLGSHHFYRVGA